MRAAHVFAAAGIFALVSCQQPSGETPSTPVATPPVQTASCPVIAHREWTAFVNAMPGPNARRTLNVSGIVDLPTPGYTATLAEGPADRSAIPMQTLILTATAPTGIVPQVVTPTPISYSGLAIAAQYRGVRIRCGDETLVEVEVIIAQ